MSAKPSASILTSEKSSIYKYYLESSREIPGGSSKGFALPLQSSGAINRPVMLPSKRLQNIILTGKWTSSMTMIIAVNSETIKEAAIKIIFSPIKDNSSTNHIKTWAIKDLNLFLIKINSSFMVKTNTIHRQTLTKTMDNPMSPPNKK